MECHSSARRQSWRSRRRVVVVATQQPSTKRNPENYDALISRAERHIRNGKPFCAVADLMRILMAGEAHTSPKTHALARTSLDSILPKLSGIFEQYMPARSSSQAVTTAPAGPTPSLGHEWTPAANGEGMGRNCIYKLKIGSLLFRRDAPGSSAVLAGAAYFDDDAVSRDNPLGRDDISLLLAADELRQQRLRHEGHATVRPRIEPHSTALGAEVGPRLQPVPTVDVRSASGAAAAVAAARAEHCVLIRHANLLPEVSGWTGSTLASALGGVTCHVLSAPIASNRFTYFWGAGSDTVHSHYVAPPTVTSVGMSYADFREHVHREGQHTQRGGAGKALYLQTGLVQRSPAGELQQAVEADGAMRAVLQRLSAAADVGASSAPTGAASQRALGGGSADGGAALLSAMVRAGGFGRYTRTALFASVPGAVTRLHYDHYDNLYVQLRGRKRFVLLAPLQAKGLYPFPMHHPLDQRSRVHVDAIPTDGATRQGLYPRLDATVGFEVDLGPGDVLFIPHHWWHHVETTVGDAATDGLSLSLNLWFDFEPRLVRPMLPLSQGLLIELARHVEAWLGMVMEPVDMPDFLAACATELRAAHAVGAAEDHDSGVIAAADSANETTLPRPWLVTRCLLFAELATSWVGWGGVQPFVEHLLCEARYRGLVSVEREMGELN